MCTWCFFFHTIPCLIQIFILWVSSSNRYLAALDFRAGVEQPFSCLIVQNCQAVQSMRRSMDWTLKDNLVDSLFFCATLTGRRASHTPFVQAGAEMPDTSAEAIKPDPGSSWEGHSGEWVLVSGMKLWSLRGLFAHSTFHWWSIQCPTRSLLSDNLSCCAAGTNGCLDLRFRVSALNGQVSAEWSRCPGTMAQRARDSVDPLRRISAGWIPVMMGRLSAGAGCRHPVTICKASLIERSIRWVWALRLQTGVQYSAVECTRARVAVCKVVSPAPQLEPASRLKSMTHDVSFLQSEGDAEENRMRKESLVKKNEPEKDWASSVPFNKVKK